MKNYIYFLFCLFTLTANVQGKIYADCNEFLGKVDVGPAYIHVDVLEFNRTVKKLDMGGLRADSTLRIWKGLCLKPFLLYANGQGEIFSGGLGLGFIFPINERCFFIPSAGCIYTRLNTFINLHMFGLNHLKERYSSVSPYIGFEACYCICEGFRVSFQYQYAWSQTHVDIKHVAHGKSHTQGSNYAALFEYDVTSKWSANIGGAYNQSLTQEKHGLRAYGFKVGATYWF